MAYTVLIVEDEKPISNLIKINLESSGYLCTCIDNGVTAANMLEDNRFDLILLDIMLPEIDGFALMEYIAPLEIPVIYITAKSDIQDRVKGLRLGADDYIIKPFAVAELLARIDVVIRRCYKTDDIITIGGITVHTSSRVVKRNKIAIDLTPREYDLLIFFIQNQGIALYRDVIFERVWQISALGDTRTVDLHVQRLRKKLGWEERLKTVYKIGYRLEAET